MELNKELVLDALTEFESKNAESNKIPESLEKYLLCVAKTGDTVYPWSKIKCLLRKKIELVVNEFNEKYPANNVPDLPNVKSFDFAEMKKDILDIVDAFCGSPFTIQRICELLTAPYKHYKRIDKFMRGLEKNVLVVTTIEPKSTKPEVLSVNHKSLFVSTSSTSYQSASSSSSYMNGIGESGSHTSLQVDYCSASRLSMSPSSPAPLQQLDSFTTVFASPPSTPLAVVSDMNTYEAALSSSSSSSSSSSESSPQPLPSSPPAMSSSGVGDKILKFNDSKLDDSDSNKDSMQQCFENEPVPEMKSNDMLFDELRDKAMEKILDDSSDAESEDKSEDGRHDEFSESLSEEDMSITESSDPHSEPLEAESGAICKESKSENSEHVVVSKETTEEVRLITEHLKETVAAAPEQMEQNDSNFE